MSRNNAKTQKNLDIFRWLEYTNSCKHENCSKGKEGGFLGTIMVGAGLLVMVGLVIRSMYKDRKAGKSHCGGDCGKCRGCH